MRGGWAGTIVLLVTTSCSSSGTVGGNTVMDPAASFAAGSGGQVAGGSSGAPVGAAGSTGGARRGGGGELSGGDFPIGGSAGLARDGGSGASRAADSGGTAIEGTGGARQPSFDAGPDGPASCSGECPTRVCGPDGTRCRSDELCVQQAFVTSPPQAAGGTSFSCSANPCGNAPVDCSCAAQLCRGQCNSAAGYNLACAYYAVCADPDTPIATLEGERRIADLTEGDLVYTVDRGAIVLAPIARTSRTLVKHHSVMRVALESGSVLAISPGHPTADGRRFGELVVGDLLDGVAIRSVNRIPYAHDATYDILPASDSGTYFAGGVLVGSTLARNAMLVTVPTAPLGLVRRATASSTTPR